MKNNQHCANKSGNVICLSQKLISVWVLTGISPEEDKVKEDQ